MGTDFPLKIQLSLINEKEMKEEMNEEEMKEP